MSFKFVPTTDQSFSLDDYQAFVDQEIDVLDVDCLRETAWALKALSNNRRLLTDEINDQMRKLTQNPTLDSYTPQSMLLRRSGDYVIRANIWSRHSDHPEQGRLEGFLNSYYMAHDHNFHFVTVGYLGSGYETEIYDYDPGSVRGLPGEHVDMRYIGREQLGTGDAMVYEASRHIHSQLPPKELSVSLNLLVRRPELMKQQQYFFNTEKSCIESYPEDNVNKRYSLIEMARYVGDENTVDALHGVAERHACVRTRAAAYRVLLDKCPTDQDFLFSAIHSDPDATLPDRVEIMRSVY